MNPQSQKSGYVFFGSAEMSVIVLEEMEKHGFTPAVIVTTPDKPKGRKLELSPTPVKVWGQAKGIPVLDPAKLDPHFIDALLKETALQSEKLSTNITLFVVAAYGKIIPLPIIMLPKHHVLNIHPSLLPLYRGAAPLQSAILDDQKETGVTIMKIDALMDHGPIIAQAKITIPEWPPYEVFEEQMARDGARLLCDIIPDWVSGKIKEREQDHSRATFTRKFTKEDGLIDITTIVGGNGVMIGTLSHQYEIFRKIQAFHLWPSVYFFVDKKSGTENITQKIRVKITDASWTNSGLVINKVVPEGKKETDFNLFMRSL